MFKLDTPMSEVKKYLQNHKEELINIKLHPDTLLYVKGIGKKSIKVNNTFISYELLEESVNKLRNTSSFDAVDYDSVRALIAYFYDVDESILKTLKVKKSYKFKTTDDISKIIDEVLSNKVAYKRGIITGLGHKSVKTTVDNIDSYQAWEEIKSRLDEINDEDYAFIELDNSRVDRIIKTLFLDNVVYTALEKDILKDKSIDYNIRNLAIKCIRKSMRANVEVNLETIKQVLHDNDSQDMLYTLIDCIGAYTRIYKDARYESIVNLVDGHITYIKLKNTKIKRKKRQLQVYSSECKIIEDNDELYIYKKSLDDVITELLTKKVLLEEDVNRGFLHSQSHYLLRLDSTSTIEKLSDEDIKEYYELINSEYHRYYQLLKQFNSDANKKILLGYEITRKYDKPTEFIIQQIIQTRKNTNNYHFIVDVKMDYQYRNMEYKSFNLGNGYVRYEFIINDVTKDKFNNKLMELTRNNR